MTTPSQKVQEMLRLGPDHVWLDGSRGLLGWGIERRIDVGVGPERFRRAIEGLGESEDLAFASFTFDPTEPGSFVVVPSSAVRIEGADIEILRGSPPDATANGSMPSVVNLESRTGWSHAFSTAMMAIERGELEKVVLSRVVDLQFEGPVPSHTVISNLYSDQPDSFIFSVDGLVGSSPELLVRLIGPSLTSISLAGSSSADMVNSGDLRSPKNRLEHDLAAASVAAALEPVTEELARSETREAVFGEIAHLATRFDGRVSPGTHVLDAVARLHPTAAVAGTPTRRALSLIRSLESHSRGRYAGPVGWFDSRGNGAFAIALRCARIERDHATLYTGSGLVEGSRQDAEFEETELKLRPMLKALRVSRPAGQPRRGHVSV